VNCSNLKNIIEKPKIQLQNVSLGKLSMSGVDLLVHLEVENPNKVDFQIKNLTYVVEINEKKVTTVKHNEIILVKGLEKTNVTLPLSLRFSDLLSSALKLINREELPYKVQGSADVGPFTIPFVKNGNLKAVGL
jgi:LEA14-like dessication related protein